MMAKHSESSPDSSSTVSSDRPVKVFSCSRATCSNSARTMVSTLMMGLMDEVLIYLFEL